MNNFWDLRGAEREAYRQSKFEYFRMFNTLVVSFSCIASVFYFLSDCQLFGNTVAWETLIPRTIILVPLAAFLYVNSRVKDYRVMVPLSYAMIHGIMWCTIWAITYLPIKDHAQEGFIIMHLMFVVVGFAAPFAFSTVAHSLVIANILISNTFNHYARVDLMLSLGIPCLIGIVGTHFAMSMVYKDQYDTKVKLENLLTIDYLTQAFNRNILTTLIEKESQRFRDSLGKSITLLVVDIDFFKRINDDFGHEAGDQVLKSTAAAIKRSIRTTDILLRWGGEEFVVIMPNSPLMDSKAIAERIRKNVEAENNGVKQVTVSVGAAEYDQGDYLDTIDRADKALYQAKEGGRNQVVCWEDTHQGQ